MASTDSTWRLGAAKDTNGTRWYGKYCPTLHVSTEIAGLAELRVWLRAKKVRFRLLDNIIPKSSVQFRYNIPLHVGEGASDMDDNFILIVRLEEHLHLFQAELSLVNNKTASTTTLTDWMKSIQSDYPGIRFTLLIQGMEGYLSKIPKEEHEMSDNHVMAGGVLEDGFISRVEIQNMMVRLHLTNKVNYRFYETPIELAQLLKEYAFALGEVFVKNSKDENEFFKRVELSDVAEKEFGNILSQCLPDNEDYPETCRVIRRSIAYEFYIMYESSAKLLERCKNLPDSEGEACFSEILIENKGKMWKLGHDISNRIYQCCEMNNGQDSVEPKNESEMTDNDEDGGETTDEGQLMDNGDSGDETEGPGGAGVENEEGDSSDDNKRKKTVKRKSARRRERRKLN